VIAQPGAVSAAGGSSDIPDDTTPVQVVEPSIATDVQPGSHTEVVSAPVYDALPEPAPIPERIQPIRGVLTDQKLLAHFYRLLGVDIHPIATDSFLDKSRDEYNAAWLTRELVQNFVDHNKTNPGTLDGVRITSKPIEDGIVQFRIEADWPFNDPTGVLSPHSEKPEGQNTAGGNGIGLKQAAIRLLRDFDVARFEIDGERWIVNYRLAKAEQINREWSSMETQQPVYQVKHDWLLADIQESETTGKNAYIIETKDPEVIKALKQLPELGVSKENPYLQEMDFRNQHGGIKWLPKNSGSAPKGRLFLNGQVMNYGSKGTTADDYWVGPEYVTLRLDNVKYKMNIDRPPVSSYELGNYVDTLVNSMTPNEIIDQIKRSEPIWAGFDDSDFSNRPGALVVIQKLVRKLGWNSEYKKSNFDLIFPNNKYLYLERGVSAKQLEELERKGYIICPSFFKEIGMASVGTMLEPVEAASNIAPNIPQNKIEQFAQDYGMEVAYEDLSDLSAEDFSRLIKSRFDNAAVKLDPEHNSVRFDFPVEVSKELLFHALPKPKDEVQKLLYLLRGVAYYGLKTHLIKKIFTTQGEFVTTFGLDFDSVAKDFTLLSRNIKGSRQGRGFVVEIEFEDGYLDNFTNNDRKKDPIMGGGVAQGNPDAPAAPDVNWTIDDEQAYTIAKGKPEGRRSAREIELIMRRGKIEKGLSGIPVSQPEFKGEVRTGRVISREGSLPEEEVARLAQLESQLPGIASAIEKLEGIVSEPEATSQSDVITFEKYLKWRESGNFYGQLENNAGYLSGKHLVDILSEQNKADIAVLQVENNAPDNSAVSSLQAKLKKIVESMAPSGEKIDDFDIIFEPTPRQLTQLGLLRTFVSMLTGVNIPNDLFIYDGTGSKGINLSKKAIGIHKSLFSTSFTEALSTFTHEVSHNKEMNHEMGFIHVLQALFATIVGKFSDIAAKAGSGGTLSPEERAIVAIQNDWNLLARNN